MHFGHPNHTHSYHLNGHILEKTDHEKDLWVLKFHVHTAAATKKANQILGVIKKSLIAHEIREQSQHYTKQW